MLWSLKPTWPLHGIGNEVLPQFLIILLLAELNGMIDILQPIHNHLQCLYQVPHATCKSFYCSVNDASWDSKSNCDSSKFWRDDEVQNDMNSSFWGVSFFFHNLPLSKNTHKIPMINIQWNKWKPVTTHTTQDTTQPNTPSPHNTPHMYIYYTPSPLTPKTYLHWNTSTHSLKPNSLTHKHTEVQTHTKLSPSAWCTHQNAHNTDPDSSRHTALTQ